MHSKILIVVNNLTTGGVTEVVKNQYEKLKENFDVSILSISNQLNGWNLSKKKINVINVEDYFEYRIKDYFEDIYLETRFKQKYVKVINYITEGNYDIVHFHTLPRFLPIGRLSQKNNPNLKLVFTDHSVRIPSNEYSPLIRVLLGKIYSIIYRKYHLVFVSEKVEEVAKKYNFIGKNKLNIRIDNAIDVSSFQPIKIEDKRILTFVYVARIQEQKGHFELIEAWKEFSKQNNHKLILVGPDETKGKLLSHIETNGVKNVELLGKRSDVKTILQSCDIGLFPSHREGLPMALLEKMVMGLPVIVSNIPELKEIVIDKENGMNFTVKNVKELTLCMEKISSDIELRKKISKNARRTIEEKYSINNAINSLTNFYDKIIKES